jgi:hypothetical protein
MTATDVDDSLVELPVVTALRKLSVFSADQAGAYREHFAQIAAALGDDARTLLATYISGWAAGGEPGIMILTGNAGTGKTAVAEAYCRAVGGALPPHDAMETVAEGRRVIKDLSGVPDPGSRADCLAAALEPGDHQTLVCANEGVLRDALADRPDARASSLLEEALRQGAASDSGLVIVNVNRQRPTSAKLWGQLLDYVTREELWSGCAHCPFDLGGCPMRTNAEQLRRPEVREQLRTLVRLGAGEAVPTLREVLAVLSWAIVGGQDCKSVKNAVRDRGPSAHHAVHSYFSRVLGGGLDIPSAERSPLLTGMRRAGLGFVSDLEVDGWLRDTNGAPPKVRELAGDPDVTRPQSEEQDKKGPLAGSLSPLDRVFTTQKEMTFFALGEMVSTDEDTERVSDGLNALVRGDGSLGSAAEALWRQRMYFEASAELGGPQETARRLLDYGHVVELLALADTAAREGDTIIALTGLIRGLNFLVTGFSSPSEGLIVPDPACLFARDPGSFRPARPSLVHSTIRPEQLHLRVPDRGMVRDVVDVDDVDVELVVDGKDDLTLRVTPRMYEAIREAADFQGPVGQGVAEMNDLRGFYGRLAQHVSVEPGLRVADPDSTPPALVTISLPQFAPRAGR